MPSKTLVHKSTSYQFYFHDFFNIFTIKSKVKRHSKYIKSAIYDYTLGKIFISCSNHVSKYFSQRGSWGCLRGSYLVYLIITLLWFNLRASLLSLRLAKKLQTPNCGVYSAILKHKIWLHILSLTMLPINCECYNF